MEPFIGQIQAFGFNFAPRGWAFCHGQILSIAQNTALFSLLGTTYGGNGQTTFALPDLRGRNGVCFGQGPGLSNINLGEIGGAENRTLTVANLPSHGHAINAKEEGTTDNPSGAFIAGDGTNAFGSASDTVMAGTSVGNTGGNQPFNVQNPYLGINYCIALVGIFPSRN